MTLRLLCCFVLLLPVFLSCNHKQKLFREIAPDKSGLRFSNEIKEDEELNVLRYEYLYNGGGVGIGDFNNDSLPDIYFTGNRVANKLFLNKGGLRFEDVTEKAGVNGAGRWSKGASIIDINNDGLQDIYVCAAVLLPVEDRKNLLYINQGVDEKSGAPVFKEEAEAYGLADASSTQMAAFFDYDNDGDLDVYLLVNELDGTYPNEFRPIRTNGSWPNTDKLLRNDWSETLHHPVFTDVSKETGIQTEGYGLGVNIADLNNDGWKDIYVSNDYLSNNLLYINNRNGTFTERCAEYLKHTSKNAMGNDIADLNNDGWFDIVELDMAPADNYRLKMMNNEINYQTYQSAAHYGYMHQYVRNTVQLNQGPRLGSNDSIGAPVFSETGYAAGVAQTDWSWAPLAIDADNDGYRDLLISNGLPKDMSDLDLIAYRRYAMASTPAMEMLKQVPTVKISNYIFRNNGDETFTDKSSDWGWTTPAFSAGMAYADFDKDGDMDVVINNTNMPASLLENTLNESHPDAANYLQVQLKGDSLNRQGLGAMIHLYYGGKYQVYDCTPYRGYMSSVDNVAHFGLGTVPVLDSCIIVWPNAKKQVLKNVKANQRLVLDIQHADGLQNATQPLLASNNWFTDVTKTSGLHFSYTEADFIDFNIQKLLPHKLTQYGPSLAAGDVNGDGRHDLILGGGSPYTASLFLQTAGGRFVKTYFTDTTALKYQDDAGICLFDADSDGDLDVFIASGGAENEPGSKAYTDHFYLNDGKGNFKEVSAFEPNYTTKSCVKAADYDGDGDLDLFVGGRVMPGNYPRPVSSFLYRNDSKGGIPKFTNVTATVAPALQNIGMVCDALWSDVDNDGAADLVLAGEWMPITVLHNSGGKLSPAGTGLSEASGWWNSLAAADVDNDGDMDYIAGNCGTNGFLKPTLQKPVKAYAGDFDNNGSFDAVFSHWQPADMNFTEKEVPLASRDELIKEMTVMKTRFPNYASYAKAGMTNVLTEAESKTALQLSASQFASCWIENKGKLAFVLHPLPQQAQRAPIYGITVDDFDEDGNIDLALNGNEFSMAPVLGRYDALNGLVLKGNGKGQFTALRIVESGIYIPGNGKGLVKLMVGQRMALLAAQNASYAKLFVQKNKQPQLIPVKDNDLYAVYHLKDGRSRKEEFAYGTSFLSQSGRFVSLTAAVRSVTIFDNKQQKRTISN